MSDNVVPFRRGLAADCERAVSEALFGDQPKPLPLPADFPAQYRRNSAEPMYDDRVVQDSGDVA